MVVVALSGQPGSGSTTVGKLLAKKLGVEFFSVGLWNKSQLEKLEGRTTETETKNSVEMWKNKTGRSEEFHNKSDIMQKEMAAKGNIVIDGKLAIHMLRGFSDVTVWLKAPIETRAERYAQRDNIGKKEAEKILREKEQLERENWQRIYGFDYFEQEEEADLAIDVSRIRPEEIVKIILEKIKKK